MASNIQPTGLDWKNLPQKTTPISAENLNKMANTIDDLVEAVNPLNTVEANPEGTPTEGLEKVEIDGTLYEVKGGHKILNDSGTTLTQKDNLQFKGVYTQNNGDNTEVDICRTMTKAQMEALSGESLKGFINTSDEPDSLPLTAEWVAYGNGSVKDGLDNKVSKTGDTITGNLFVQKSSGDSNVVLGGSSSRGVSRYYDETGHFVDVYPNTITTNRAITLPDKSGTVALTSDFIPLGQTRNITATELDGLYDKNVIRMGYLNSSNMPFNSIWGTIINHTDVSGSTRVCNQILITQSGIAMRHYEGSSWSAWKKTSFA